MTIPDGYYHSLGTLSLLELVIGTPLNLICLSYFISRKTAQSGVNCLFLAISSVDLMMCSIMLFTVIFAFSSDHTHAGPFSSPFVCNMWGVAWHTGAGLSVFLVAVLSITRWRCMVYPLKKIRRGVLPGLTIGYTVVQVFKATMNFWYNGGEDYNFNPFIMGCTVSMIETDNIQIIDKISYFLLYICEMLVPAIPIVGFSLATFFTLYWSERALNREESERSLNRNKSRDLDSSSNKERRSTPDNFAKEVTGKANGDGSASCRLEKSDVITYNRSASYSRAVSRRTTEESLANTGITEQLSSVDQYSPDNLFAPLQHFHDDHSQDHADSQCEHAHDQAGSYGNNTPDQACYNYTPVAPRKENWRIPNTPRKDEKTSKWARKKHATITILILVLVYLVCNVLFWCIVIGDALYVFSESQINYAHAIWGQKQMLFGMTYGAIYTHTAVINSMTNAIIYFVRLEGLRCFAREKLAEVGRWVRSLWDKLTLGPRGGTIGTQVEMRDISNVTY